MMMTETLTETFNSSNTKPRRLYKKHKDYSSDISSTCSGKNSICSSTTTTTTNGNDWHRLLLARLKQNVAGKYRTINEKDTNNKSDGSLSITNENPRVIFQSYTDESSIIDPLQINMTESDSSKHFDPSGKNSMRRDSRFIKNSISYRTCDHMTSLKRRVRKQQMRHVENQTTILHETTFELPSPANLFLMSYPEPVIKQQRRYKPREASSIVPLPLLMNTPKAISTDLHTIKLNLYKY